MKKIIAYENPADGLGGIIKKGERINITPYPDMESCWWEWSDGFRVMIPMEIVREKWIPIYEE